MSDHENDPMPTSESEVGATPEPSHGATLAAQLQAEIAVPYAPSEAPPQSVLLKDYDGELPPEYVPARSLEQTSTERHIEDPAPEGEVARESDEEFYGPSVVAEPIGSKITSQWPIVGSEAVTESLSEVALTAPAPKETQAKEPGPETQQELDRQTRELVRRDTLQSLDSLAQEIGSKFRQVDNLREDLRQDRRTIINKLGGKFLEEASLDPKLRDKPELRQTVRNLMSEMVDDPFKIEPSQDAEKAMNDRTDAARTQTVNALGEVGEQVAEGDLTAPERETGTFSHAIQDVTKNLNDTLMLDDQLRAAYIDRLTEIVTLLNREGISSDGDDYVNSAKLVDRMRSLMRSKEWANRDPNAFRDHWQQDSRMMQREYDRVAKKAAAAPAITYDSTLS